MSNRVDLNLVLANNLRFFMGRRDGEPWSANELGVKAGIAPNTVRNYLDYKKRTVTSSKPIGFPTLDKLARLSAELGCEVWELLHPDIERSVKEREMYARLETDFLIKVKNGPLAPPSFHKAR